MLFHSIRGSIDAFIIGFDKFMNLILKDCDEEYVITTQQVKSYYALLLI